jgi:flagellar basal-body rod protein FlgB
MKLFDKRFVSLEKSLDNYTKRAELLANNIANVNTPKYKRKDIQFENFLDKALNDDGRSIVGKRTDEKHFNIGFDSQLEMLSGEEFEEKATIMRNDGNNVDIEKEKVEQAKNNIRYQFASNRISQNFNILKSVIKTR